MWAEKVKFSKICRKHTAFRNNWKLKKEFKLEEEAAPGSLKMLVLPPGTLPDSRLQGQQVWSF